ncbi:cytosolic non-specific dipeptidase-like isoform X1 [Pocillopora damicornis]|uniref:cytosolic non-specific dipeptidase-like isoform X1 n=1 Tax=Pocillopora damicornis TaxID=46731 RepID=UPI000F54FC39|nr:cytosolic non-specific dipeptidase-like isoform X1 [Pocillopora damicornis]XP_027036204.1 cytosolic non-specific dipeptidase-like isoform X1 [Pocillopora damicornis]
MAGRSPNLKAIFNYVDEHQDLYVQRLSDAVAIQSVSGWTYPPYRDNIVRMINQVKDELISLGGEVELADLGMQHGANIPLPPVLLGILGKDPAKKTLCVYGHLDVQPAKLEDGWDTDPFTLTEIDGKLYGRGSTDDKGPVLAWLNAIEAYQKTGNELPINLRFVFEGMEESGSEGLDKLINDKKDTFFKPVDYVCISDNYWLGKRKPCITYGLRGICYFFVEVSCASKDLHSGVFGGTVHEAMTDLIYLLNNLVDLKGNILIPGINDKVLPLTDDERATYTDIDFDKEEYRQDLGHKKLIHNSKEEVLMRRWRYPSLSIHGIEGAFYEPGSKTVIPRKVIGKFSIRLVPDMTPEEVDETVCNYIKKLHEQRGSPNPLSVSVHHCGPPWVSDINHVNYQAARRALKTVHGVDPDLTRDGCSIPVTLALQDALQKNIVLLPIGACDDGAHSQNEKINITNYIQGTKALAAYLEELGHVKE